MGGGVTVSIMVKIFYSLLKLLEKIFTALKNVRGKYNDINDDLEYKKPLNSFSI